MLCHVSWGCPGSVWWGVAAVEGSLSGLHIPPELPCWTFLLLLPGGPLLVASCSTRPSPGLPTLSPGTGPAPSAPSQGGTWNPSNLPGCQLPASHCPFVLPVCLPEALLRWLKPLFSNKHPLKGYRSL